MAAKRNVFGEFFTGVGMLGKGFGTWRTAPALMLLGAVPALIVAVVYTAGLVVLLLNLDGITIQLTTFAENWDQVWRGLLRGLFALAFLVVFAFFWVYTYTALTLTVGDPFYERIWRAVEQRLGNPPPDRELGFWREVGRGIGDFLRLFIPTVLLGLMVFALGLIPLVGGVVAVVLGAFIGGWFLAVETTGLAFDARGHTLRERRRTLRSRRRPHARVRGRVLPAVPRARAHGVRDARCGRRGNAPQPPDHRGCDAADPRRGTANRVVTPGLNSTESGGRSVTPGSPAAATSSSSIDIRVAECSGHGSCSLRRYRVRPKRDWNRAQRAVRNSSAALGSIRSPGRTSIVDDAPPT